ncbi:TonB-dependent receptor plug domain-containing protein [Sandarakinorhabdus oryzae]|uniref:TonB-dependent receptor plug domain-containing protein n=1 Tax=Sandarakinorhabdus oryzae TaxID=2675220 RepID=UPI001F26D76F|nr:TonB-dependent receptor [Sandarakinorhabdus oryzae]
MKSPMGTTISRLLLAGSALPMLALAVTAAPAAAQTAAADEKAGDEKVIVVVGTRRTDRSILDTASPVDVVGAAELATQPASNVLDIVKALVPSFYVGQNAIADASTFVRAPSLRGLSADEVLVQLNGKRLNRSALVQVYTGGDTALSFGSQGADISTIPSLAIGSLQILRDGATAQYGSDAIAGVMNYGLREDAGLEVVGRYGQYYRGDGESFQIAANAGVKLGDRGFINLTGEYTDDRGTVRNETRPLALIFAQQNPGLAGRLPNYPGPAQIYGTSPGYAYRFLLNSAYELSPEAKIYFTANYSHLKADQSFNYRSPISATNVPVVGGTTNLNANAAFATPIYLTPCPANAANNGCPAGGFLQNGATYNFTTLYPAGFTPRFVGVTDQYWGVLGIKGKSGDFTYDLSGTIARNSINLSMYDSLSPSFGPQSQTSFQFGKLIQEEQNLNADFTYAVDAGLASPVTFSFGGEFRRETYTQTAGDVQSYAGGPYAVQPLYEPDGEGGYQPVLVPDGNDGFKQLVITKPPGASGYGGTSPTFAGSRSQQSFALYAGAETDLTDTFSVGAMGRYERYNSFGSAFVGKGNFRWEVVPSFAIRGTAGTGFHAPSPGQNNTAILTTTFVNGDQVQVGTYPVTSNIARYFGATQLRPERSTNFGLGFVFTPTDSISLTVDAYSIKVKNRIGISQNFDVTAADIAREPALLAVGDGGAVNYFTNAFDTRTRGIDVVGTWRGDVAGGKASLILAYNYNKSTVTRRDTFVDANGDTQFVIGDAQVVNIGNLAPNHRANLTGTWQKDGFAFTLREAYYGSWREEVGYPGQKFGAKFTTDIDVSYTFMEHYTVSVGAINLFNTYPDRVANSPDNRIFLSTNSLADGQIYPNSGGPFGFNGGFWYARIRVKY